MYVKLITATMLLASLIAAPASAGPLANAFHRQQVSIGKGLVDGSLNAREAQRLENREVSIRNQFRNFKASGGGVNFGERLVLAGRLINARRAIHFNRTH